LRSKRLCARARFSSPLASRQHGANAYLEFGLACILEVLEILLEIHLLLALDYPIVRSVETDGTAVIARR